MALKKITTYEGELGKYEPCDEQNGFFYVKMHEQIPFYISLEQMDKLANELLEVVSEEK